jgi:hypothetical protein
MTKKVLDCLDRHKGLVAARAPMLPWWQDLADMYHPYRGGFTSALEPNRASQARVFDGTPMQARRGLATAIDALLKPKTERWFWLKASRHDDDDADDEEKRWFDVVQSRMWDLIYAPPAGFIPQSGAVDNDLTTFGLGYLWVGENRNRSGLMFEALHIGDVCIDRSADGPIDTLYRSMRFTARQAEQKWGDKLGPKVKEALADSDPKAKDKLFEFVHAVYPREERDERKYDGVNMPFASMVVCVEDEYLIEEGGFEEFPVAVPRWEVPAGQVYPRSPGMIALPDARTLQSMGHTLLVGGQRAVMPPTWSVDEGASLVRTFPGGHSTFELETVMGLGGKPPIGIIEMGGNIPVGQEMQESYRKMVGDAFYASVFSLPVFDHQMTATEIRERKEEFIRTIGPTMGQLENDYIGAVVTRSFNIMLRRSVTPDGRWIDGGVFPEPPDSLKGSGVQFEFMSPVQQAKRQIEMAGIAEAFQFVGPVIELQPEAADNLDGDEIVRDMPSGFGLPQKYIRTKDAVAELRQARQEAMQAQQALMEANAAAQAGKTGADAMKSAAQAEQSGLAA